MAPAEGLGRSFGGGRGAEISVVVCTTGRRSTLWALLTSLAKLDDPPLEVLVVENARHPRLVTADLEGLGARHVWEPRTGLDIARNRGALEASGAIVAYVDDDCEVDPGWLHGIRRGFTDETVALVTGRVVPASLELLSQQLFERWCSWDRGVEPFRLTRADRRVGFPASAHHLGTGCNMAFRRDALLALGGFDEALDMGTLIGGGGDLDVFVRVIDAGHAAAYEPTALVHHTHRQTRSALRWQVFGYGTSQGAVLAKGLVTRRPLRGEIVELWAQRLRTKARQLRHGAASPIPRRLILLETIGILLGPFAYLPSAAQARWRRRR